MPIYTKELSSNKIFEMYGKVNYYDLYGGSIFMFVILIIILMLVLSYTSIMINIQPIKDNWAEQRCNPKVIPFAGLINKPEGSTTFDFTQENYNYCVQNILTSITGEAVEPLSYITSGITAMFGELLNTFNRMRDMISYVRTSIGNIAKELFGRIMNVIIPFQQIFVTLTDIMAKIGGILTTSFFTVMGVVDLLKSFLGGLLEIFVIVLIAMSLMIIGLFALTIISGLTFNFPLVAILSASSAIALISFIVIAILCAILISFLEVNLGIPFKSSIPPVPTPSMCFDKNTKIELYSGSFKNISQIKIGEVLKNKSIVTAILKLDATQEEMFILNGVIVSGSHPVMYNNEWILVKQHPKRNSILNYNEHVIYCLNTTSKIIEINELIFSDWDEVFKKEATQLINLLNNNNIFGKTIKDIHKYYDTGFHKNTIVFLQNGYIKEIKDIQIGDILEGSIKVIGIVKINGMDLNNKNNYLECLDEKFKCNELYHLVTDQRFFWVNRKKYNHYNSCIEDFL